MAGRADKCVGHSQNQTLAVPLCLTDNDFAHYLPKTRNNRFNHMNDLKVLW